MTTWPILLKDVFVICISPIIHLGAPPPPPPQKNGLSIVLNFFWGDCNTQEELKSKVMQNLGGQTSCIIGDLQMVKSILRSWILL